MSLSIGARLQHAWSAFRNKDPAIRYGDIGPGYGYRPDRVRFTIYHARLDDNNRFTEIIESGLNTCLTLEANIDQTARAFFQDAVMSMLDEGCVALVPVDTTLDPNVTGSYDIQSMRTAQILEWYPEYYTSQKHGGNY